MLHMEARTQTPSYTYTHTHTHIHRRREQERELVRLQTLCQQCMGCGRESAKACVSVECSIMFDRQVAQRECSEAAFINWGLDLF